MMRWLLLLLATFSVTSSSPAQDDPPDLDVPRIRYIRAYGGSNEMAPPVVLLNNTSDPSIVGSSFATIEFDISSSIIPNVYAKLVHCNADWTEDENGFLNDVTQRTSMVDWSVAPQRARYYNYRGKLQIPNPQMDLRFSGNWKVKIYDMEDDRLMGESRFFAVEPEAFIRFNFMTDFYEPKAKVSSIALTLEAIVDAPSSRLLDPQLHTCVFYRNHRWHEPYVVSNRYSDRDNPDDVGTAIRGVFPAGKVFRVSRIPAQNEYRVLDLTNLAQFPNTGEPVKLPLSDIRRNGMFIQRADDGAMVTNMVSSANDEYVPVEFLLDPSPGYPSEDEVFIAGSFNNWNPDRTWMMWFDENIYRYRLRQWVRRGRHNYLYATGRLNVDTGEPMYISFEEWEGNTASASNSYIAFAYYTVQDYGGYDGLIAVGASNIYQSGR